MKIQALTFALLLSGGAIAVAVHQSGDHPAEVTPEQALESPVRLIFAQAFFLDEPYAHAWRSDQPLTSAGYIIAVSSAPDVVGVRQVHDELLFVGDMPVERINEGSESGVCIGFVPSPLLADGSLALDLGSTAIYWAKPEILPESLSPADAERTHAVALAAGVAPQRARFLERALAESGGAVYLADHGALHTYGADVIERFSPQETDLIGGLRAPLIK